ncbi:MAG: 16S rRNA (adenine(1518)-N(6)/adenine(1519)-N(6))-dimethyltransferase RsmA [Gammaproteobacteria bacterium]
MTHRPRKRFGQHFLHDPAVIERIVTAIHPRPADTLVEIGPGRGAITIPLLRAADRLHVVELDRDLIEPLRGLCRKSGELIVHSGDALRFDFCRLAGTARLRITGNLPYNISTPLLFHLLASSHCIEDMHFMLQKEVVQRIAAGPGSTRYGRLSVMLQYHCEVTPLFNIGAGAFQPPPRVESAFVRLIPHREPPVEVVDETMLAAVVRRAFAQRRKTLRNALRGLIGEQQIRALGIDPAARAEMLGIGEFAALANYATAHRQGIS